MSSPQKNGAGYSQITGEEMKLQPIQDSGYPQGQQGYPPQGQQGYPPQGQPGYPPQGQPGYPPQGQPGYPPQGQYPVIQQPGYPIPNQVGTDSHGFPIATSQQPGGWMTVPQSIPNCPPGLEYLSTIDQLLVHQKIELLEAFTGFETNNKFTIKNSLGQKVYWAVEDNDCCTRNCLGSARPFEMNVMDAYKNQIIHFNRAFACDSCCFPCCLQTLEVSSPPGTVIGTIEQQWSFIIPHFDIKNAAGETILKIEGPCCTLRCCSDVEFQIKALDGTQVGTISKQWTGLTRELFTDADHFGINFPIDLDVKMKAVCLGAVFLIDAMFFEHSQ